MKIIFVMILIGGGDCDIDGGNNFLQILMD